MRDIVIFIDKILKSVGAAAVGAIPLSALHSAMSARSLSRLRKDIPGTEGVITAAFPYFAGGEGAGNGKIPLIARYARGKDYHSVLGEYLSKAANELNIAFPENKFHVYVDASPIPEVLAARLSGLGMVGGNGLIMIPEYGSYVFIGCIVTDLPLPSGQDTGVCGMCGLCAGACPAGALKIKDGNRQFYREKCLSAISQKKGELSSDELHIMRKNKIIWGCDRCLDACPENKNVRQSSIPEFTEDLTETLELDTIANLNDESFTQKYGDKAFAWRGRGVIARNLNNILSQ